MAWAAVDASGESIVQETDTFINDPVLDFGASIIFRPVPEERVGVKISTDNRVVSEGDYLCCKSKFVESLG